MKKILSVLLVLTVLLSAAVCVPVQADDSVNEYGTLVRLAGTTVRADNKTVLNQVNALRKKAKQPALKMDQQITKFAYERALMLAVNYSKTMPTLAREDTMPQRVVIARGKGTANIVKAIKNDGYIKNLDVNSCGIANLKIGKETFWAALFTYELKAHPVTSYSKAQEKYAKVFAYDPQYLKVAPSYNKYTAGTKLKEKATLASRKLYLRNYNTKVNNYVEIKNYANASPLIYTSTNKDAATVDPNGKVTAVHAEIFRPRKSYTPKKGDFIFFKWEGEKSAASHVAIVYAVKGTELVTVEGNADGNVYNKSKVVSYSYEDYKNDPCIVGYMDMSVLTSRKKAIAMADLAYKQLGKGGKNFYNSTAAWIEGPTEWCSIFCAWLMEQKGIDPARVSWSACCPYWIAYAKNHATATIRARLAGTARSFNYTVTAVR